MKKSLKTFLSDLATLIFHDMKLESEVIFLSVTIHIIITYLVVAESCVQQSGRSSYFCPPQYFE